MQSRRRQHQRADPRRTRRWRSSRAACANYELTDELDTVGPCDFDGTLSGGYTAHPHRDPTTGELHAVSYSFARGRTVQYSVIDTDGHARRTVDIEVSGSPMMHDFSLTDKYVVHLRPAGDVRPDAGAAGERAALAAAPGPPGD